MGYVLPVTNYQYQDYHKRVTPDQRSPFILDPVFKVTLDHKLKEHYNPREQKQKGSQHLRKNLHTPQTMYYKKQEDLTEDEQSAYSKITGKGQRFSESI
ncbi:hypothetical protein [Halobacillus seohaensis]|uniref:Uncharacterized protein n=1 Tax=Halobacillus seohaensis TaxID=447421 RepID=A0ABW2EL73_9BACI